MAEKSAGRVLLIPKGVFTIGTNYTPLDFVAFGSNNYVCKKATDGTKTPVEDTASWQMLAAGFDSHNIAAEYSEEATYHTGDICISGGNLYKAKQDINAAEAFTAGHWEEITVGQELTSLETTKADANDVTTLKEKVGTTALTTAAADLSGAVNEVKTATDTNASAITKLNSESIRFINTSRVIVNEVRNIGNNLYTATEDCFIVCILSNVKWANSFIDNKQVSAISDSTAHINYSTDAFLKKGQAFEIQTDVSTCRVMVYGLSKL